MATLLITNLYRESLELCEISENFRQTAEKAVIFSKAMGLFDSVSYAKGHIHDLGLCGGLYLAASRKAFLCLPTRCRETISREGLPPDKLLPFIDNAIKSRVLTPTSAANENGKFKGPMLVDKSFAKDVLDIKLD